MGGQIDVNALIGAAVYIVPILALMISVQTFNNAVKERRERSATEAANIKADLTHLTQQVNELRQSMDEADSGYHSNASRIIKLEEQVKTLWNKMTELEKHVRA